MKRPSYDDVLAGVLQTSLVLAVIALTVKLAIWAVT